MTTRKYERGAGFTDVHDLIRWLDAGGCIYWSELSTRALAPSFMASQRYMTLKSVAYHGCRAVPIQDPVPA